MTQSNKAKNQISFCFQENFFWARWLNVTTVLDQSNMFQILVTRPLLKEVLGERGSPKVFVAQWTVFKAFWLFAYVRRITLRYECMRPSAANIWGAFIDWMMKWWQARQARLIKWLKELKRSPQAHTTRCSLTWLRFPVYRQGDTEREGERERRDRSRITPINDTLVASGLLH